MAKVSATLRPAASQSGMYIRSRMSFHLVLSVAYGFLTCVTKVNVYCTVVYAGHVTSVNMVIAELTYD